MKIIVDHTSMQPIYEQIVEQIKKQILQGTLREGAPLDSVRMLAKDLKVSALTVKKAYEHGLKEASALKSNITRSQG